MIKSFSMMIQIWIHTWIQKFFKDFSPLQDRAMYKSRNFSAGEDICSPYFKFPFLCVYVHISKPISAVINCIFNCFILQLIFYFLALLLVVHIFLISQAVNFQGFTLNKTFNELPQICNNHFLKHNNCFKYQSQDIAMMF